MANASMDVDASGANPPNGKGGEAKVVVMDERPTFDDKDRFVSAGAS